MKCGSFISVSDLNFGYAYLTSLVNVGCTFYFFLMHLTFFLWDFESTSIYLNGNTIWRKDSRTYTDL